MAARRRVLDATIPRRRRHPTAPIRNRKRVGPMAKCSAAIAQHGLAQAATVHVPQRPAITEIARQTTAAATAATRRHSVPIRRHSNARTRRHRAAIRRRTAAIRLLRVAILRPRGRTRHRAAATRRLRAPIRRRAAAIAVVEVAATGAAVVRLTVVAVRLRTLATNPIRTQFRRPVLVERAFLFLSPSPPRPPATPAMPECLIRQTMTPDSFTIRHYGNYPMVGGGSRC